MDINTDSFNGSDSVELSPDDAKIKDIQHFASSHFGEYAGIAQQYLFYYARENN